MAALNHSNTFYKGILDHMLEGCQIVGHDWRYLYLNDAVEKHNRRPNAAFIGNTIPEMWPGIEDTELFRIIRECMEARIPYTTEYEFTFPDGTTGWFELRISPIPEGIFILSLDIAERKRMEEENEKLQQRFVQAQKLESVGKLAGGVAHDFNNMLGVILGRVDIALGKVGAKQSLHSDLLEIRSAAQRSAKLTGQLLAFARRQPIDPKILDLNDIILNKLDMLRGLAGESIDLTWMPGANLGLVKMDASQIDQILANLCINARDAISGIGKITIETRNTDFDEAYCAKHPGVLPGAYVVLTVSDDGCGIRQETLGKIFEPFFTTKNTGKGPGLGLAMIYGIIKQNNGLITVYSESGQGTSFNIYLPRYEAEGKAKQADTAIQSPQGSGETILLVEDELMILNLGREMLEALGYRVLTANTPGEALRLAQEHKGAIDMLLTDIVMPEMNGSDLAARLQATLPDLKTLFMSGYPANIISQHGILREGVKFLHKPFSKNELAGKVFETLKNPMN